MDNGQTQGFELWVRDVLSGGTERVLPGYVMQDYSVSADGKEAVFAKADANGHTGLWAVALNHRSAPRHLESSAIEDSPRFLPNGDVIFRSIEGGIDFLYRMRTDGSQRQKISPKRIFDLFDASPNGQWAVVLSEGSDEEKSPTVMAVPVEGGAPVRICSIACVAGWSVHGEYMFLNFYQLENQNTYLLPLGAPGGIADLAAIGNESTETLKKLKTMAVIPHRAYSIVSKSLYAYTLQNTQRNLYRIPLQ
jgi:hypothetical protein